jgi:HTH-type transcriptional regulator, transcriptional repressor of NAD biosynthesis genes
MHSMARWPTGLVMGRFCPPHLGHGYLIEQSAARVDRLVVYVNTRLGEVVPGALRAGWLRDLHPVARVVEVAHDLDTDFGDPELWARWMALLRSHWPYDDGPHAVFTSEAYGSELARRWGATEVLVDPDRVHIPVSATMIRTDPLAHLDRLAPPVREWVERWGQSRQPTDDPSAARIAESS